MLELPAVSWLSWAQYDVVARAGDQALSAAGHPVIRMAERPDATE